MSWIWNIRFPQHNQGVSIFTLEQLNNAYEEAGSMQRASILLNISKTSFRQQYLKANNKCTKCMLFLDKDGLICSSCLKKSRDKVKNNLPKIKNCNQCNCEIERNLNQSNIAWTKQKICENCLIKNNNKCSKNHYNNNKEKYLIKNKTPERIEYFKKYRKTSEGKLSKRISNEKRRAQKVNTTIEDVKPHIEYLFKYKSYCYYCSCENNLQIEHLIPLSRNGTHTKDNLVLACRTCNTKKGNKTQQEFYNYLGVL